MIKFKKYYIEKICDVFKGRLYTMAVLDLEQKF
jgi:hypothetical protein